MKPKPVVALSPVNNVPIGRMGFPTLSPRKDQDFYSGPRSFLGFRGTSTFVTRFIGSLRVRLISLGPALPLLPKREGNKDGGAGLILRTLCALNLLRRSGAKQVGLKSPIETREKLLHERSLSKRRSVLRELKARLNRQAGSLL